MSKTRSIGRMIRRDLAEDESMARLSDGAARLYFYLLPHLDSHGKFSGGPGTIQETIVPLLGWSRKRILSYLVEINSHTSVRVWTQNGRFFVHDERFFEKQEIREDRRGRDTLPPYPGPDRMKTSGSKNSLPEYVPDLLPHEVEVEVERKVEEEVEVPETPGARTAPLMGASAPGSMLNPGPDRSTNVPRTLHEHSSNALPKDIDNGVGEGKAEPRNGKGRPSRDEAIRFLKTKIECADLTPEQAVDVLVRRHSFTDTEARKAIGGAH
jgi:hypothetical protein